MKRLVVLFSVMALVLCFAASGFAGKENWPKAVEQFQKAQNLLEAGSPTQGQLLYDLGIAFERLDRYEDALRAFNDSKVIRDTTNVQDAIDRVQERIRRGKGGGGGGER